MIAQEIIERAHQGTATREDALQLLKARPFELYKLADQLREKAVGDRVTYIKNRNINFTDICIGDCKFCAFKNKVGYRLSMEQIKEKITNCDITEVCIQGGLLPDADINLYLDILRTIKQAKPDIHAHCFSPMEVYHATSTTIEDTLKQLKAAGLNTMPGTAAEILCDRVRNLICPHKITTLQWEEIITTAHKLGIPTTSTMMYGHLETWEERIDHILTIRRIQQQTGGFTEFVPLPFMPCNNPIGEELLKKGLFMTTGIEDLKVYAISRILLHTHIDNIQASWVKLGKKLAQMALLCGASDLGGTLMEESISKAAGAAHGESISEEELEWIITAAQRKPVQRDTIYRTIKT